jgi:soluble lytic murein transglycosylase-like protein
MIILFFSAHVDAIPSAYRVVAKEYSIPPNILYSIAFTESGYQYRSIYNPWPWTLNIEGKAYRFKDKASTLVRLRKAINHQQSVDIGIMQINWRWHKHRFNTIESTLDPYTNLHIGAEILLEQYHIINDWWLAVGRYHTPAKDQRSTQRAKQYVLRVKKHWRRIHNIKDVENS